MVDNNETGGELVRRWQHATKEDGPPRTDVYGARRMAEEACGFAEKVAALQSPAWALAFWAKLNCLVVDAWSKADDTSHYPTT